MKYTYFVYFSIVTFLTQFVFQHVFSISLPFIIRAFFVAIQASLLVIYLFILGIYFLTRKQQPTKKVPQQKTIATPPKQTTLSDDPYFLKAS